MTTQEILEFAIFYILQLEADQVIDHALTSSIIEYLTPDILSEMLETLKDIPLSTCQNIIIRCVDLTIEKYNNNNILDTRSTIPEINTDASQVSNGSSNPTHMSLDHVSNTGNDTSGTKLNKPSFFQRYCKTVMIAGIVACVGICVIKKGLELYGYL